MWTEKSSEAEAVVKTSQRKFQTCAELLNTIDVRLGQRWSELSGLHYLQRVFQSVIQFHDGCLVSTAVAVVWSTKDGHHVLVMAPVITLNREEHTWTWDLPVNRAPALCQYELVYGEVTLIRSHSVGVRRSSPTASFCHNLGYTGLHTGQVGFYHLYLCIEGSVCITSMTSWWARETRVSPLAWLKVSEMSCPKV